LSEATSSGYQLETNPKRVLFAFLTAAFVGVITVWSVAMWDDIARSGWQKGLQDGAVRGPILLLIVFPAWLFGLVLCGGPVWALLHKLGLRRWWQAIGFGFLEAFLLAFSVGTSGFDGRSSGHFSSYTRGHDIWINGFLTREGWQDALTGALTFGAFCGALGFVIWYVAYKRLPPILS